MNWRFRCLVFVASYSWLFYSPQWLFLCNSNKKTTHHTTAADTWWIVSLTENVTCFFCYLLSFKIQVKIPIHLKLRPSNDVSISLDSLNLVANFEKKTCILLKRFFYTRQPDPFLPTTIVSKFTRLNFFYSHCLLLYIFFVRS